MWAVGHRSIEAPSCPRSETSAGRGFLYAVARCAGSPISSRAHLGIFQRPPTFRAPGIFPSPNLTYRVCRCMPISSAKVCGSRYRGRSSSGMTKSRLGKKKRTRRCQPQSLKLTLPRPKTRGARKGGRMAAGSASPPPCGTMLYEAAKRGSETSVKTGRQLSARPSRRFHATP